MKRINAKFSLLFLLLSSVVLLQSCADKTVRIFESNVPVFQSLEEFRAADFTVQGPRQLQRPGKIYIYGQYLFVNEMMEGVHIFDNSSPSNPVNLAFLPVHANMDLAVNSNVLYLDSYYDLLAFDISNPASPQFRSRVNGVFSFQNYGYFASYNPSYPGAWVDESKGVVIGWTLEKVTEETSGRYYYNDIATFNNGVNFGTSNEAAANPGGPGIGGSTARFTVWDNHLYTLEPTELGVFSLAGEPVHLRDIALSRNAETLFPAEGYLYIGTTTGMLIYNLVAPSDPAFVSEYNHFASCDPVAVQGDKAFVTLSTGRTCAGWQNVLEVIDLSNIANPTLMYSYPMTNPKGLGLDGDLLFLCDGPDGLKIFDKSDLADIPNNQVSGFGNITSADVIPYNGTLIMTSEEGIFQYDYNDPENVYLLSQINIVP